MPVSNRTRGKTNNARNLENASEVLLNIKGRIKKEEAEKKKTQAPVKQSERIRQQAQARAQNGQQQQGQKRGGSNFTAPNNNRGGKILKSNSTQNTSRFNALATASWIQSYNPEKEIHGGYLQNLPNMKTFEKKIVPERMENLLKIWFALDTMHDLVDGNRSAYLKDLILPNEKNNIDDIDKFLFNENRNHLQTLILNNLKGNEEALKNVNRNFTFTNAQKSLKVTKTQAVKQFNVEMLKKTMLSNLLSQVRQIPSERYMKRALICSRNDLSAIFELNNITILEDATKQPFKTNTVQNEAIGSKYLAISPSQLSNSATTTEKNNSTNNRIYRKHIYMDTNLTNTEIETIRGVGLFNNSNRMKWFKQCTDEQLYHTFKNYCGVIDDKINTIVIEIVPKKYQSPLIKYMIIHVNKRTLYKNGKRYEYNHKKRILNVNGRRGVSVNELGKILQKILVVKFNIKDSDLKIEYNQPNYGGGKRIGMYNIWTHIDIRRLGWLITDIKRSQDSTQVSFIREYNKNKNRMVNSNDRKKLYLITQDLLCACRCVLSKVGCIFESKGRYFIFGSDDLKFPIEQLESFI